MAATQGQLDGDNVSIAATAHKELRVDDQSAANTLEKIEEHLARIVTLLEMATS